MLGAKCCGSAFCRLERCQAAGPAAAVAAAAAPPGGCGYILLGGGGGGGGASQLLWLSAAAAGPAAATGGPLRPAEGAGLVCALGGGVRPNGPQLLRLPAAAVGPAAVSVLLLFKGWNTFKLQVPSSSSCWLSLHTTDGGGSVVCVCLWGVWGERSPHFNDHHNGYGCQLQLQGLQLEVLHDLASGGRSSCRTCSSNWWLLMRTAEGMVWGVCSPWGGGSGFKRHRNC